MNKISLSAQSFDPKGLISLQYDNNSEIKNLERRVSRTATLDGGCSIDDFGFSWSDVSFNLKFSSIKEEEESALSYFVKTYGLINIVTKEGAFEALIEGYSFAEGNAELRLLIVRSI